MKLDISNRSHFRRFTDVWKLNDTLLTTNRSKKKSKVRLQTCEKSHEHIIPQLTQCGKGGFEDNIISNAYLKTEDSQTTDGRI